MKAKILVVDDTALSRMGTAITVKALGFATDEAASGPEALDRVGSCHYALILMDYNMWQMDGIECTQKIRALESKTGTRVPIVALTSSNEMEIREKCLQAGMDDYLDKSYSPEELQEILAKWL